MTDFILSIDQGTTSSRALLVNANGEVVFTAQQEFAQLFPRDGWVEHDPEAIWQTTLAVSRCAMREAESRGGEVLGIGITNQRETTVAWNRDTGEAVYNAIVWQDRRTAETCAKLRDQGYEQAVADNTGLLLDPYFSATKLNWILNNVAEAGRLAKRGKLAFGTIDSFLIWRLTGGKSHLTDATNASRTLLFNIHSQQWHEDLLALFSIPQSCLPAVADCVDDYGLCDSDRLGKPVPICGVAGDQQAALFGQCCFRPGMVKSTYGTGCFMMMHSGNRALKSSHRLLTTIASRIKGQTAYALEGSIFIAGAAIQWLRDELGILDDAAESEMLAESLDSNNGVYMVPAFTGLGSPHWNPHARGAVLGLTRDTGKAGLVRAALESIAYQTRDVFTAMIEDGGEITRMRVDGGMANNRWFCQFLADILNLPVDRPVNTEASAIGAAYLAGLQLGLFASTEQIATHWQASQTFEAELAESTRQTLLEKWTRAVNLVSGFS